MAVSQFITFSSADGVATVLLNRPDLLNSFNREMAAQLQEALARCAASPEIRCVLLSANGRGFCAGQDLAEVQPRKDGSLPELGEIVKSCYNPIIRALRTLEKPVVCAVNGVAAGAGANLALACDIVLASYSASFIQSFAKVGLIPDSGGTFFLPRLIGLARATSLAMLAEKLSAEDAQKLGLVYKLFTPEALMPEALKIATCLAQQPTKGLALMKRALNSSFANNLEQQLELEAELQAACGKTHDYREGVMSFLEKRPANFKGQ